MQHYRTPLRYPGGKQRLWQFVREVIEVNGLQGGDYCEPFAGGAGVAMELLLERVVRRVYLNDASRPVYGFWHTVKSDPEFLCRRIRSASLTVEEWKRQREIIRNHDQHSLKDVAFAFFYMNRCNRSGIVSGGVIGGLDQNGPWKMDARFNRKSLVCRVEAIAERAASIHIQNLDAIAFIRKRVSALKESSLVYLDPPYFRKSERLYLNTYKTAEHESLATLIQSEIQQPWIVSYDATPEISSFYRRRTQFTYDLQHHASRSHVGRELFIFADGMLIPSESSIGCINSALASVV